MNHKNKIKEMQNVQKEKIYMLNSLLSTLAHDIKQPLNSIQIMATGINYMNKRGVKIDLERVVSSFEQISEEIDRVDGIIRELRSSLKFENFGREMKCDLEKAIDFAYQPLKEFFQAQKIKFTNGIKAGSVIISANQIVVSELFLNLFLYILNACSALKNPAERSISIAAAYESKCRILIDITVDAEGMDGSFANKLNAERTAAGDCNDTENSLVALLRGVIYIYKGAISASCGAAGAGIKLWLPAVEITEETL